MISWDMYCFFQGLGLAVLSVLGIILLVVQLQPKVCQLFNEMTYVLPVWDWRLPHKILDLVAGERWESFLPSQGPRRRDLLRGVLARRLQGKVNPPMPFWDLLKDTLQLKTMHCFFLACMTKSLHQGRLLGLCLVGWCKGFECFWGTNQPSSWEEKKRRRLLSPTLLNSFVQ